MIAILIYPLGYSFVMSFYRWDLSAPSQSFIGLSNYRDMLTNLGLQQSLRVQLVFSVLTISIEVAAGIGVAVLVNGRLRGLRLARTLLLVPPMIAPAVVGLNFRWLFNGQYGLVNAVLRFLGLPEAPWLSDPHWALASVMIADIWQNTRYSCCCSWPGCSRCRRIRSRRRRSTARRPGRSSGTSPCR